MKTGIFRDELPGERKSIINTLMWGWILVISILGYFAFYLTIQLDQVNMLLKSMPPGLTGEEFTFVQNKLSNTITRLETEILWLAVLGSLFAIIGGVYTFNLVVRPLRKLVKLAEGEPVEPPEIKSNNEIKQLLTAIHTTPAQERESLHLKN